MSGGEQLSDDDIGLRSAARRVASALLKFAVLVGIVAGGVWAYAHVEKWRAVREQSAAEQKAAVDRLVAAGGDGASHEGRLISANFTRRPADDEGFAALAWFTSLREIDARPALRVTNDGLRHLAGLRDLESLDLTGASAVDGRGLAHLKGLTRLRYLTLDATDVGDDGLEHLRDLPALQFLSLTGTLISDAGLALLRRCLSNHEVIRRSGASLAYVCRICKQLRSQPSRRGRI
jgi:hypothetical protein